MLFRLDDLDHTFQVMNDLHRRLDRALGAAGLTDVPRASELGWVDLTETPDELVLRADLPGVDADALDISPRTVKREWRFAQAWLQGELTDGGDAR